MLAVNGIYDGKSIQLTEAISEKKKFKVIVTFIEELSEEDEIRNFSAQTTSFDFWNDKREDIYQEFLEEKIK